MEEGLSKEAQERINQLIAIDQGIGPEELTGEEKEKFLSGFSMGALVFSAFYFIAMRDKWVAIVSAICAIFFPPALIIFPFIARRRAYNLLTEPNFSLFKKNQIFWDKAGWYGLIFMIIIFWLTSQYIYSLIAGSFTTNQVDINQLNDIRSNLQDITGN